MLKIKQLRGWGIYALNKREQLEYGFSIAVIHPDRMGTGLISPKDTDMELETIPDAISWIENY